MKFLKEDIGQDLTVMCFKVISWKIATKDNANN